MKKVKLIFPDGSIADIDEADVQAALNGGAKRYTEKATATKQVKFADGSIVDLDEQDANTALSGGATLVKKKAILPLVQNFPRLRWINQN